MVLSLSFCKLFLVHTSCILFYFLLYISLEKDFLAQDGIWTLVSGLKSSMLTTTLWRLAVARSVRNDILKLRLLMIGANSWGKGGIIYLCFHEEKGDQHSIAGSTYILMICNVKGWKSSWSDLLESNDFLVDLFISLFNLQINQNILWGIDINSLQILQTLSVLTNQSSK